jgi:hypothetical protein
MSPTVYRIATLLSTLLCRLPIGTNLAMVHLFWMLLSGRLLASRGALFPALAATGLAPDAVRRAWAALAYGRWEITPLVTSWQQMVEREGYWQAHTHAGLHPVACDLVGFFRPRLQHCPSQHFSSQAGKALPAISLGIAARIGHVGSQRVPLPCLLLRADPKESGEAALQRSLIDQIRTRLAEDEIPIFDRGFPLSHLLAAGLPRFLLRGARNFTARRAFLPEYKGHGRPPTRGEIVRPLARQRNGTLIPATPPDRTESWVAEGRVLHACFFDNLVERSGKPGDPCFHAVLILDPKYREPLLLLTPQRLSGRECRELYRDRWPVEQVPLAGKQLLGAERQFVFAPESRQRLPELALFSGAILMYVAATQPAEATGFWDRRPQPTAGRLRRVLARTNIAELPVFGARVRKKRSVTEHLPKGVLGHRRRKPSQSEEARLPLAA